MENQNPTQNQPVPAPVEPPKSPPTQESVSVNNKVDFISILNSLPKKLLENKKRLITMGIVIAIFFVLMFILSVILKNVKNISGKKVTVTITPSPTPYEQIVDPQKVGTVAGELSVFKDQLIELKNQIDNLDVEQSRLKPPSINFKIDFTVKK